MVKREEFFKKLGERLRTCEKDGWAVPDKAWSVFDWGTRLRNKIDRSEKKVTDSEIKDYLSRNPEISKFLATNPSSSIDDLVYRTVIP